MSNAVETTRGFKSAPLLNGTWRQVEGAGKVKLVVDSVRDLEENDYLATEFPDSYIESYLINFQAVESRNIPRILEAFQMGEGFTEEDWLAVIPWESAKGMTFSHRVNVFCNKDGEIIDKRPMEGDELTVTIRGAVTKAGDVVYGKFDNSGEAITDETPVHLKSQVMEVADYIVPKAKKAKSFMDSLKKSVAKDERPTVGDIPQVVAKEKVKA